MTSSCRLIRLTLDMPLWSFLLIVPNILFKSKSLFDDALIGICPVAVICQKHLRSPHSGTTG